MVLGEPVGEGPLAPEAHAVSDLGALSLPPLRGVWSWCLECEARGTDSRTRY